MYSVGSGHSSWASLYPAPPTPLAVTESDTVYPGGSFPPLPAGDLLTSGATTVVANTLTVASENVLPSSVLYDGNIGAPLTTNSSYEISGGAVTFYLGPGANGTGYTITNLNTYTAWRDNGRENANYTVSFSTDGTNFSAIASVAYNPSPYPTKDGTGGTLTSLAVTNLTGVKYLKWNFSAAQQNGGVGYTELAVFGQSSPTPGRPALGAISWRGGTNLVLNVTGLASGQHYVLQSTTNLATGVWLTETDFVAGQTAASFTNSTADSAQKYYRIRSLGY